MYNVFVLEDEIIVSMEIQGRLQSLGYNVCGSAASGEKALEILEKLEPDLALLDIRLKGELTGIDVANRLHEKQRIPYLFLTSHSDKHTLDKAKLAYPFGYLLKPIDEYSLHTNIEVTIIRHKMEQKIRERENWLYTTLRSIGDGVIITDEKGKITFINPTAEKLSNCRAEEAIGKYFPQVIELSNDGEKPEDINPAIKAIRERKQVYSLEKTRVTRRDGKYSYFQTNTTPIIDQNERILGAVILFRDIISNESN